MVHLYNLCYGLFTLQDTDSDPNSAMDIHPEKECGSDWESQSR